MTMPETIEGHDDTWRHRMLVTKLFRDDVGDQGAEAGNVRSLTLDLADRGFEPVPESIAHVWESRDDGEGWRMFGEHDIRAEQWDRGELFALTTTCAIRPKA